MEGNLHRIAIKIGTGIRPLRQADGIEPLPGAVLKRSDDQVTVAAQIRIQKIQAHPGHASHFHQPAVSDIRLSGAGIAAKLSTVKQIGFAARRNFRSLRKCHKW